MLLLRDRFPRGPDQGVRTLNKIFSPTRPSAQRAYLSVWKKLRDLIITILPTKRHTDDRLEFIYGDCRVEEYSYDNRRYSGASAVNLRDVPVYSEGGR